MAQSSGSWRRFRNLRIRKRLSQTARNIEVATTRHARHFVLERWNRAKDVRQNIGIWLIFVGVLVAAVIIQFLLVRGVYTNQAPVEGGTYAEGVNGRVSTLNPLFAATQAEQSTAQLIFSSLFDYDNRGSLSGDLATGYKRSEDGRTYTVTLRDNATWHDGKPVTVDDILFTVNLLKNPAVGSSLAASWEGIQAVKINKDKVAFNLPAAYVPFPHALTFPILPKHILENVKPNTIREHPFSTEPIGSGPFAFRFKQKVKSDGSHEVLHLKQNTAYYGGQVKLERFQLHAYANRDDLVEGLRTQAIGAASGVPLNNLASFDGDSRFDVNFLPVQAGVYALMNTESPTLKNEKIRKALQLGTNVDEALSTLSWKPKRMDTPFAGNQMKLDVKKPGYNIAKAKKILDESGWKLNPEGFRYKDNKPLQIRLSYLKDTDYESVVGGLVEQWRKLGIKVETQSIDAKDPTQNFVSSVLQPRNFDVLVHELTIGADPDIYAYWHSSQATARGLNFSNYKDDISDDALSSARSRQDELLRVAKYESFLRQWYEKAPAIGLYQSSVSYVAAKGVQSVQKQDNLVTEVDRYYDVVRWTARSDSVYKTP